ncbi:hypothetical protein Tco_1549293 [Tanacetum coccineum]
MSSITTQTSQNLILNLFPRRKDLRLGNATEDSILERYKKNPHFKSFWMLLLSLNATLHFSLLQMFQKSTCINSGFFRSKQETLFYRISKDNSVLIMSSITTQQAKVDLELVPKEKILEIGKCNGRLNPGKIQREPTFQMFQKSTCINSGILFTSMTLSTDSKWTKGRDSYSIWKSSEIFLRSALEYRVKTLMHSLLMKKLSLINKSLSGKTTGLDKLRLSRAQILWAYKKQEKMYYPRFTKVIIHYFLNQDKTVSWRNKIRMHTSRDDYLINTLGFVSAKEATQIYVVVIPESLTNPKMKETKAYKTYLGFATGPTPPKKARKFKKLASPQLTIVPVSPEEPTRKSKRVKRHTKKSTKAPARGVVIRETLEMPLSKKKEKVDVARGKGIELLSKVALTEDA